MSIISCHAITITFILLYIANAITSTNAIITLMTTIILTIRESTYGISVRIVAITSDTTARITLAGATITTTVHLQTIVTNIPTDHRHAKAVTTEGGLTKVTTVLCALTILPPTVTIVITDCIMKFVRTVTTDWFGIVGPDHTSGQHSLTVLTSRRASTPMPTTSGTTTIIIPRRLY